LSGITNGTKIEINATGTQVRFYPGWLVGSDYTFDCPITRGIGYFVEGILPLAAFGKEALTITFTGVTDGMCDSFKSCDYIQSSLIPLLSKFGVGEEDATGPYVKVTKRGFAPEGQGEVVFYCPMVRSQINTIDMTDMGMFKRARGCVVSACMSSSSPNRVAYSCKGVMHKLIPDVWIATKTNSKKTTDKRNGCGPSPGLAIWLAIQSTTGVIMTSECQLDYQAERGSELPEDLGSKAANLLLEEINKGGCIDTAAQSFMFVMMCITPEDVSKIRIGTLSKYSIQTLRLLKQAFDIEFKVKPDEESKTVVLTCLGSGFRNMARAST